MGDLVERLADGNVPQVKAVLASVALALAVYQLALIAVGYGKVRPPFLDARPASRAHRASGDVIVVLLVVVAAMCLSYFGVDDEKALHEVCAVGLLAVLALKVVVLRWWTSAGAALPYLGTAVFVLLTLTWLTVVPGVIGGED